MAKRKSERDVERVRLKIAEASAAVFAQYGFVGATVQMIAREAGYSAPTLYAYFEGKRSILTMLMDTILRECSQVFRRPPPVGVALAQALELMLRDQLLWIERRRQPLIVLMKLPNCWEVERRAQQDCIEGWANWLSQFGNKDLGAISPIKAAWLLFGMTQGAFIRWIHHDPHHPLVEEALPLTQFFLAGLKG